MDKRKISIHQAGHTLMFIERNLPIKYVEINYTNGKWIGNIKGTIWGTDETKVLNHQLYIALGGILAEEIFYPSTPEDALSADMKDLDTAHWIAGRIVPPSEVSAFIADRMEEVRTMLTKNRVYVQAIARLLELKQKVFGREVHQALHCKVGTWRSSN